MELAARIPSPTSGEVEMNAIILVKILAFELRVIFRTSCGTTGLLSLLLFIGEALLFLLVS
jgi:hypothetical protein